MNTLVSGFHSSANTLSADCQSLQCAEEFRLSHNKTPGFVGKYQIHSDESRRIRDVKKKVVKWPRVQPRFSRRRHADPRPVRRGQNQNYAGDGLWTTLIVRKAM